MMWESELQVEHAVNSMMLIHEIRSVLNVVPDDRTEWTKEVTSLVSRIDEILKHTPDKYLPTEWRIIATGLRLLNSQITSLMIAEGGKGNLIEERFKCDVLFGEVRSLLTSEALKLHISTDPTRNSLIQTGQCNYQELCAFLLLIPLPILYWHSRETRPYQNVTEEPDDVLSPLLRVIVFLDHVPIASPQLLKSNILYPLVFRVRGLVWPDDAVRLRLDLLTTCPPSTFSVSEFTLDVPRCMENGEYQGELAGQVTFNSGQSSLLDDLIFIVRCAFETSGGHFREIPVIGHSELRLKVTNEDRYPLMTGNRRLDTHIAEIMAKLLRECPRVRDELSDLLNILEALTRLLSTYAQEAVYKGRNDVAESEFQKTVLRDLRFMLGQDVQEHPSQAGGITDIKYRGIIVELKVEKENGDRAHITKKYTSQSVQYAGVEARQISIVLVLDLTSKDKPPGDIRNDIIFTDVETHGGGDGAKEFPSKTFVFVVNGNMKSPSTYSR